MAYETRWFARCWAATHRVRRSERAFGVASAPDRDVLPADSDSWPGACGGRRDCRIPPAKIQPWASLPDLSGRWLAVAMDAGVRLFPRIRVSGAATYRFPASAPDYVPRRRRARETDHASDCPHFVVHRQFAG